MPKKSKRATNPADSFFAMPKVILNHPDFLSMSWAAQALLVHIGSFYNGFNNGDLAIPHSVMKDRGWCKATLNNARMELIKNQWIIPTRKGCKFYTVNLYALSWKILDECKGKLDISTTTFKPRTFKKT